MKTPLYHITNSRGAGINESGPGSTRYKEKKVSLDVLTAHAEIYSAVFGIIENSLFSPNNLDSLKKEGLSLLKRIIKDRINLNLCILEEGNLDVSKIRKFLKPQSYKKKVENMPQILDIIENILKK